MPAAAQADNIAYVKDHNVWIANPDGSGAHQVTLDGTAALGYTDPSQADDGTLIAAHGNEIVRLRQNGRELNRFNPPASVDSASQPIDGVPQDLAISPDGSKLAYVFYTYNCPIGVPCNARQVLQYASADGSNPGYGRLFLNNPSWVTGSRILAFGGYLHQVNFDTADGGTDDDQHWFDDKDVFAQSTDLGDGELSRQGDRLALVRGYGPETHLAFYAVTGNVTSGPPPATPEPACLTNEDEAFAGPTWSPDGKSVAFDGSDGVEVLELPNVVPGDCPGATSSRTLLPGASDPDWGPAPVAPGPRDPADPDDPSDPNDPGSLSISAPAKLKLKQAARKGIRFDVSAPSAGSIDASASVGRKQVAVGSLDVSEAGVRTVRLEPVEEDGPEAAEAEDLEAPDRGQLQA